MLSFEEQKEEKLRERIRKKRDSMRCLRAKRKAAKEYMNYLLAGGTPSFVAIPSPTHITSNNNAINCSSTLHLYNEEEFDIKSLDINYIEEHAKRRMAFTNAVKDGEKLYKIAKERQYTDCSVDTSWSYNDLQRRKRNMRECWRCYMGIRCCHEYGHSQNNELYIKYTCLHCQLKHIISATSPAASSNISDVENYLARIDSCIRLCGESTIINKKFGDVVVNDGVRLLVDHSKMVEFVLQIGIQWLKPRADGVIKQAGISQNECKAKVSDLFRRRSDHVLKRVGNLTEASLYADLAVHYNPTSIMANRQRGYAMHACGNTAQALISLEKAVELADTDCDDFDELIEELEGTKSKRKCELRNLERWKRSDRTYSSGMSSSAWREKCLEEDW